MITRCDSDVSGAISQPLGMYIQDCVETVHPSTSTPATVEYCHNPDTVTVLEIDDKEPR
jgi:hypothetical protein